MLRTTANDAPDIVNKLRDVEVEISEEKGDFALFALVLREDAPDVWDLLISAPWANQKISDTLKYMAEKLREKLSDLELIKLSRIVVLEKNNSILQAFRAIHTEHLITEMQDLELSHIPIRHAYLITSRGEPEPENDQLLKKASNG